MTDTPITSAQGWTLSGACDGENWTLHVSNDFGQGASLDAACDRGDVYCPRAATEIPLKDPTLKLFGRWFDQYDAFVDELKNKRKGI
jgi:hypothetical protein